MSRFAILRGYSAAYVFMFRSLFVQTCGGCANLVNCGWHYSLDLRVQTGGIVPPFALSDVAVAGAIVGAALLDTFLCSADLLPEL